MKRPPDRPAPPPDPASVAREYLVLSRQARIEGIGPSEERRRQELREVLLELGRRPDPDHPGQRQFPRAPLKMSLWYGSAAEFARAFAASLGTGGVMLHTKNPYPAGSELTIDFRRGSVGTIRATVAWSTPDTMGLRFLDLRDDQQDELEEMVCWALAERVLDTPTPAGRRAQLRPGLSQAQVPKLPPVLPLTPFARAEESGDVEPLIQPALTPPPLLPEPATDELVAVPPPLPAAAGLAPPVLVPVLPPPLPVVLAPAAPGPEPVLPPPLPVVLAPAAPGPEPVLPPPLPAAQREVTQPGPVRPPPLPAVPVKEERRTPALRPGQGPSRKK